MAKEDLELQEEIATEEAVLPPAAEGEEELVTTKMSHTVDEIPELAPLAVGDPIGFTVVNISEDGKTYDMEVAAEAPAPEAGLEGMPGGREAIRGEFL